MVDQHLSGAFARMQAVASDAPHAHASISFVCEPGRLEAQAVLLAASLRDVHGGATLVAALPGALPAATERAFAALDVKMVAIANPLAADYPIGNKIAALAAGEADGLRVFLDSDMLCLRPLDWSCLTTQAIAAKPADVRTFGNDAMWQCLYERFGLPLPTARVMASVDGQLMHPYFNTGMLATTEAGHLSAVWADVCCAIDRMQDIQPVRPWLDQIGLPLAAARLGLATRALGESWNYPAHIKLLRGTPALVHYHLVTIVTREPRLMMRVGELLEQWPEVAEVVGADAAWVPVMRGIERQVRSGPATHWVPGQVASAARGRTKIPPRDLIITGIPRSGTSHVCRLLDRFDNTAVVNEPQTLFEGLRRSEEPWAVPLLHDDLRARIDAGEAIQNKLDAHGELTEDTALQEQLAPYRARVRNAGWVLASKNTLAYMARLDGIFRVMPGARVVACVRHPLDTLASWKATFAHLAQGDPRALLVGGLADPFLPAHLRSGLQQIADLTDPAIRRAAWWRLLATEILRWGNRVEVVRYEDLVIDPDAGMQRVLGPLAGVAGEPVGRFDRSTVRSKRRQTLDEADWKAVAMLCADVAEAFGYAMPARPGRVGHAAGVAFRTESECGALS